jgi:hypothetical protein
MTLEELVSRWEQMRNDIERQLEMLRSGQIATHDGLRDTTAETINDLNGLRKRLEALLIRHGRGTNAQSP